jgi:MFS family permease
MKTAETVSKPKEIVHEVEFDEALMRLGFGKFNYIIVVVSGIIMAASAYESVGISYVFPVAECDLEMTTQDKGMLSAISCVGMIASLYLWGFLSDNFGRKRIILPTLLATFIFTVASGFVSKFWMVLVLRFCSGFSVSGSSATIFAYLAEFHSSKNRSKIIMGATFIFGVACNYFPLLGWLVINADFKIAMPFLNIVFKPWRLYLLLLGVPSLLCAMVLLFLPESPKYVFSKGNEEGALKILKRIYRMNNGGDDSDFTVTKILEDPEYLEENSNDEGANAFVLIWRQLGQLMSRKYVWKTFIACLMQFSIYGSTHGLYMFFPELIDQVSQYSQENSETDQTMCQIYEREQLNASASEEFNVTTADCLETLQISTFTHSIAVETTYTVFALLITFIINRVSKLSILVVVFFGCGLSGIATIFTTIPLLSINFYVVFMLSYLAENVVMASTCDMFPTQLRSTVSNMSLMFGRIGSVVGSNMVGYLLDRSCNVTFLVSGIAMCSCGIISCFIPGVRKVEKPASGKAASIHPA